VLGDALGAECILERAAPADVVGPENAESARLSEQILGALVDEHGRESQNGSVRAWLRKRPAGHAE